MNPKLEKTLVVSTLFRLYKNLLTAKQVQYLELYIDEDWSLQEIAQNFGVSRNAVYDAVQKTILNLDDLEQKLGLQARNSELQKIIQTYQNSQNTEVQKIIQALNAGVL